ncbi:GNAT family N-acetyltransferase [Bacillaceae bacterium S4-13-56]
MEWICKSFNELSNDELYQIMKARVEIFVVEQECPYPELDGHDQVSQHLYGIEDGQIAVYARLVPKNTKYKEASIGRVIVTQPFRGRGYGHQLMEKSVEFLTKEWNETVIKLQAQEHLRNFYGAHGFEVISEPYMDDGIPHVDMLYPALTSSNTPT